MTNNPARRRRGRDTEHAVAAYLSTTIWPHAQPVGPFQPGRDITGTPGVQIEIKARRDLALPAWLRQTRAHGHDLPLLIVRPDGSGVAHIGQWAAVTTLDAILTVLLAAGYGTDPKGPASGRIAA